VKVMPLAPAPLEKPVVSVNGTDFALPFDVAEGQFAELEDGSWTLYALDGTPMRRVKVEGSAPSVVAGENTVAFSSQNPSARAEVTVTGLSDVPFPALKAEWTDETRRMLAYEAAWPELWAPSRGMGELPPVRVRPGERARFGVEIVGPVDKPVLTLGGERRDFPVVLAAGEALRMDDGRNWRVVVMKAHTVRETGRFDSELPSFDGEVPVALSSADSASAAVQIRIIKNYQK